MCLNDRLTLLEFVVLQHVLQFLYDKKNGLVLVKLYKPKSFTLDPHQGQLS